jgi:hypothetical protein
VVRTVASVGLGLLGQIWRVSCEEVVRAVRAADRPDAQAVFISCTNLATYDVIAPLERELGKPVLTANQVTMWAALQLPIDARPHVASPRREIRPAAGSRSYFPDPTATGRPACLHAGNPPSSRDAR